MRVAICIPTYRRPDGLRRLLAALDRLDGVDGDGVGGDGVRGEEIHVVVVVVDNDASRGAAEVAQAAPLAVHYVAEPRKGLAFARNRAVAEALSLGADQVAFIDDDEVPEPGWLAELVRVQRRYDADAVVGPVLPVFDRTPPPWVTRGGFFGSQVQRRTGEPMTYGVTNNVLLSTDLLDSVAGPFSLEFNESGGEDTHFFMKVALARDVRIVWADDARVVEHVPPSRTNARWLVRRQYRRGNTLSLCLVELVPSRLRRVKRLGAAAVAITRGVGSVLSTPFAGRVAAVSGAQRIAFGAGLVSGLLRMRYREYRTVHGD